MAKWSGGYAEWIDGEDACISVAFTWLLGRAFERACWYRQEGRRVRVGGPALFLKSMKHEVEDVAECGGVFHDAIARHNPDATIASRGCPVGCHFCIVPQMEGTTFTLLPTFPVRPILCDNNLSALPDDYQDYIVSRYRETGVPLLDANSGFEPRTFTTDVYERWRAINKGPWRFAFDDQKEAVEVEQVCVMLKNEPQKRKRVYVLIGNEPFAECMDRIERVIAWGCEPHVQPYISLNALERRPTPRYDWTERKLSDVARWANGFVWKKAPFSEYDRTRKNYQETYDDQQGLFTVTSIGGEQ